MSAIRKSYPWGDTNDNMEPPRPCELFFDGKTHEISQRVIYDAAEAAAEERPREDVNCDIEYNYEDEVSGSQVLRLMPELFDGLRSIGWLIVPPYRHR